MLLNPYRFAAGGEVVPESEFIAFYATGAEVEYVVPSWVNAIRSWQIGGAGGPGIYNAGQLSGAGGYTAGLFAVTPSETLKVRTGQGGRGASYGGPGGLGGYPGGGSGSFGDTYGGGGGGYSGVFRGTTPILIAGAGGGGSGYSTGPGNGGGFIGGDGYGAGTAGTQTSGGTATFPGSSLQGGNADGGNRTVSTANDGGGGGGGYYGGGVVGDDGRSGGGGSGFIGAGVTNAVSYRGTTQGVRPSQVPATIGGISTGSYGQGVSSIDRTGANAPNGNDGLIVFELLAEFPPDDPYELGTWSVSSVYSAPDLPRREVLTDFDGDPANCTGAAATSVAGESWIKVDLGSAMPVGRVTLGGGNIPDFGNAASYVNGAEIQYSPDNGAWTAVATVSGVTDTLPLEKAFTFTPVSARYWRIRKASGYLATTTFKLAAS